MQKMKAHVVLEGAGKKTAYEFDSVAVTSVDADIVVKLKNNGGNALQMTFARADLKQLFGWKDILS